MGARWKAALREELGFAAEIAGLVGFAVVQPILGPYGQSPETFVTVGAGPSDIVTFALVVAFAPVVVIAGLAATSRLFGPSARSIVQTVVVSGLAGLAATAIIRRVGAGGAVRVVVAVEVALLVAYAHRRWKPAQLFLRFASPTPVLLVASFLFATPVAPLVRPPADDLAVVDTGSPSDAPPVLMVVLDELPTASLMDGAGGIDAEHFPNFARLADTSTWYRNHTAVASRTAVSIPSIITGRLPIDIAGKAAVHADYPDSIFSLLAPSHRVHAVEWLTKLCPGSLCPDDPPPLDADATALLAAPPEAGAGALRLLADEARSLWWGQVWPPSSTPDAEYVVAGATKSDELARPGLEFLSGLTEATDGRPPFDYVHLPVPHVPWLLLPSGANTDAPHPPDGIAFYAWSGNEQGQDLAQAGRSRHLLQLQWADRLLGAIIDRLEELGRWDDSVVVVTADHGVSFTPGTQMRNLVPANQADVAWAPLFIKTPGQGAPAVNDDNVLAVDVLPTIADLVGVEPSWEVDGISLVDERRPDGTKLAESTRRELFPDQDTVEPLVELDVDGLSYLLTAGTVRNGPDDLWLWRYGRHGDLLGRTVTDLGTCPPGPRADYRPPENWTAYTTGALDGVSGALPLWHQATIDLDESIDVAVAHDGAIVGWAVTRPRSDGGSTLGVLLTEPLVQGRTGVPQLYQVTDGPTCRLAPLTG